MRGSLARARRRLPAALLAGCLASPVVATADNLLPNSSFEAGIDARLAIGRWYVDGLQALTLDADQPVHGRYSLRVPYSRVAFRAAPRTTDGIEIRSAAGVRVAAGQTYSLTAWVRSDVSVEGTLALLPSPPDGKSDAPAVASSDVMIGRKWQRIGLTFRSTREQDVYWDLNVRSGQPGSLWLDALALEQGTATPYAPAAPVEAGVAVAARGAIFTAGDTPVVNVTAFNASPVVATPTYQLAVQDLAGKTVDTRKVAFELAAGAGAEQAVRLPTLRNGIYKVVLSTPPAAKPESEVHLSVLPPRREVATADGAFGAYATLAPEPLQTLRRAGFTWLASLTSNGRMIYWDMVEPREGTFIWYDADLQLARSLGFGLMFNLEPCKTPAWAKMLSREKRIERWSRYVSAMATHYGSAIQYWTIADEVSEADEAGDARRACWQNAAEYAPWHVAGVRALRAADPDAKVLLNADPDAVGALLEALPAGSVDILADNAWNVPQRMERWPEIMSRFGVGELWAPGIAINTPPWYAGHRDPSPETDTTAFWAERNREVASGVVRTLAAGARRLFQYTATYVGNTNAYSLFEADSSLKPIGVQFASLIWLLDGSVRAEKVPTGPRGGQVAAYRFERRDGKVVYPLFGPAAAAQSLRLDGVPASDVTLYDHFANPLAVREVAGGGLELPIGRDPVFLMTTRTAAGRVDSALSGTALRLDALPDATRAERAGNYAILHGFKDALWRPQPNVSLWFHSATRGWIELLRYRASTRMPTYRVSPAGFDIDWKFERGREAFFLEPGGWPAGLVSGATLFGSRPGPRGLEWQASRLNAAGTEVVTKRVAEPGAALNVASGAAGEGESPDSLTLLLEGPVPGFSIRLQTTLAGEASVYDEQPATFGGWRLLARPGNDYFLHQYYREGPAGPVAIHVRLEAQEAGAKPVD